jgi:hypothetical protein
MKELTTAERKVYNYIVANQPVADTEIRKAFEKSVPRAKEFLPRLQRNGYISVSSKQKHGNTQILFYSVKAPSAREDVTFDDTFTKMGTDTAEQTTPPEEAPQTTPPEEAPTTDQTTPTMEEAPTTTEEALQTTTMEEAPTTELDNPFGGIADHLRAQQEAPEEPISPVATSGQFSEEEGEKLYQEILSGRRYGQIGFSSLKNLIDGVILGDTDPETFFEVFRHYYLIMSGREVFTNEVIPNKEVRQYLRAIIGDNDVQSPSQYVFHIVKDKKHFKINKQDISKSQWVSNLQAKATN